MSFGIVLWGDILIGVGAFVAGTIFGPPLWAKVKAVFVNPAASP